MSIGSELKAAREARKATLEEVATRTKIPQKYLEALEEGRHDIFPSQTYVTGFIRAYAKVVGLDPAELTRRFKAEAKPQEIRIEPMNAEAELEKTLGWKPTLQRPTVFRPASEEESLQGTLDEDLGDDLRRETSAMRHKARSARRSRAWRDLVRGSLSFLSAAGIVAGGYYGLKAISHWRGTSASATPVPQASAGDYVVQDKYQHLLLKALDRSWVLVQSDDGATRTQLDLEAGQFKVLKATKNFRVRIGNAGGVVVQYNQTPLGILGTTGQVVEIQLPPGPQGLRVPLDDTQESPN
jgi:transcriptional regulator with XRE-family HTH domain